MTQYANRGLLSHANFDMYCVMVSIIEQIQTLTDQFSRATNRAETTVSRLSTGSGDTLSRLRRGHSITTARADRALQWFSDHWPAGLDWPADIPRPEPRAAAEPRIEAA